MPLPFIMAGISAASTLSSLIGGSSKRKRAQEAARQQIAGLQQAHQYNTRNLLKQIDQIGTVETADKLTRMRQARREAGRVTSLNQAANAFGSTAEAVEEAPYGSAGLDVGIIQDNAGRAKRSVFTDIATSRLTLNSQIASINAGLPQKANPFLSALSLGSSALGGYVQGGGELNFGSAQGARY